MRIAVTSIGPDLSSQVDTRFGRCAYFLFVDPDTMDFEAVFNPNVDAMSGAGIQSAQLVANKGVEAVLTGSCGPNSFQTLQAAGVKVIVGVVGTVQNAVIRYKTGQLQPISQPNVPPYYGAGYGGGQPITPGQPMGPGFGRGMGRGMGRGWRQTRGPGIGYGMGYGPGYGPMPPPPVMGPGPGMGPDGTPLTPEKELQNLKHWAEFLRQQLQVINQKIDEMEKKR